MFNWLNRKLDRFSNRTFVRVCARVSAAAIAIGTFLVTWYSPESGGFVVELCRGKVSPLVALAWIGIGSVAVAIVLFFQSRRWHSTAWLLSGIGLSCAVIGHLAPTPSVEKIGNDVSVFESVLLLFPVVLMVGTLALGYGQLSEDAFADEVHAKERLQSSIEQIRTDAETKVAKHKASLANALTDAAATTAAANSERARLERARTKCEAVQARAEGAIEDARKSTAETAAREAEAVKYRLYESQLIGALILSLGFAWRDSNIGSAGLNFCQGNLDTDLADLLAQTQNSCWLMELKRGWEEIGSEAKKSARKSQYRALLLSPEMRALAERCHWLGWGESTNERVAIQIAPYWRAWRQDPVARDNAVDHERFARCAFTVSGAKTVGVLPVEFQRYVKWLAENGGKQDDALIDQIPVMFLYATKDGIHYGIEPSIQALGLRLERGRRIVRGRGQGFGKSPGVDERNPPEQDI